MVRGVLVVLCLAAGAACAQDLYFDSAGARIRYVDEGRGEPVVLIHGFTGTIERSWINTGVLPDLARNYRVVALDLRGHGHSDKPHDPAVYDEIGEDVVRLLEHLKIERAHAVGYSLGGIILARLLVTHPQRFKSALLGGAAYRRSRGEDADRATEEAAKEIEAGIYRALARDRRLRGRQGARRADARAPRPAGERCRDRQGASSDACRSRQRRPGAAAHPGDEETLAGTRGRSVAGRRASDRARAGRAAQSGIRRRDPPAHCNCALAPLYTQDEVQGLLQDSWS